MNITIITSENRRLYPAAVYHVINDEQKIAVSNIDDIYDLLYKDAEILVISNQYDQYGNRLKLFNGRLEKLDIKAMYETKQDETNKDLSAIMTLSEAAEKWGLSNGSTIRKAIERGKFEQNEIKQAGNVWIITYAAMERVFGAVKNEEDAYILYDDFVLTKAYYDFSYEYIYKKTPSIDVISKMTEVKYEFAKKQLIEGLEALRNNKKVIIKRNWNGKIIQVINSEDEYLSYIELFYSRKNLSTELIQALLKDLKEV